MQREGTSLRRGACDPHGARLELIYVIEWSPFTFQTAEENEQRHKRREAEIATATASVVEPALKQIRDQGLEANGIVRHGNVGEVLSQVANELDAKQIVVGRIGESAMRALVFGSVTSKLIQLAKVPVTVVP